jgi:pimeloyl-ACP methyl ester carboxylesterase
MALIKLSLLNRLTKAALLLVVISLHGSFVDEEVGISVHPDFTPTIEEHLGDGDHVPLESISFYSKKNDTSRERIVRQGQLKITKNALATVLICHGYMCDKTDTGFLRTIFKDYNVLTFDFRAHGQNTAKQYCTFGREEAFDVIGAVNFLKSRPEVQGKPIIAYGFSMGAVSAIEAQSRHGKLFDAMILDCPFDSSDFLLARGFDKLKLTLFGVEMPFPGRELLQKYAYNPHVQSLIKTLLKTVAKMDATEIKTRIMPVSPVESIEKVGVPCLFITCKHDEKVPVDSVIAVYSGAKGYKRLWITNGRRHFDSFFYNPEKYVHRVHDFIGQFLAGNLAQDKSSHIYQDPNG